MSDARPSSAAAGGAPAPWPDVVWTAPALSGVDARGRRELEAAGRLARLGSGEELFRAGDPSDSFFVVARGKVALRTVRRGDDGESELRTASPGQSLGEEAVVPAARRSTAAASEDSVVAEVPVHVFRRVVERAGHGARAASLERELSRAATRDLLRTLALSRDLPDAEIEELLDAASYRRLERGEAAYRQGDPARELFLVADGLIQIQIDDGDRLHVRAYVGRGDFFGDGELDTDAPRAAGAVAAGPTLLLSVPAPRIAAVAGRHPDLLARLRRIASHQAAAQRAIVGAAAHHTQHVFRDLYRLQIARSLLTIDLDVCMRCGHCAWACAELYGTSRLVRRGDKLVTRVDAGGEGADKRGGPSTQLPPPRIGGPLGTLLAGGASAAAANLVPRTLMLPNSCQHCEHPSCMVDCPTGAIGRDPEGEVFVRDELCTGCGACAKACPWDNIQIAPRPADAPRPPKAHGESYPDVAVKCDLCRSYESGPACVQACPVEAIARIHPAEELADVRDLLGGSRKERARKGAARPWAVVGGAAIASVAIAFVGALMHARGAWVSARGAGLTAGMGAAMGVLSLLAYAVPKRGVKLWMRERGEVRELEPARSADEPATTSRVAPHYRIHLALGMITLALVVAHVPWPIAARASAGGAALVAMLATAAIGAAAAILYHLVPRRLARIERTALLPEDFGPTRRTLLDRLYRDVSGKSDLVKKIFEKILLPYAKSPLGPLALLASRRTLREEEQALRARVERVLQGRGKERLAGLGELVRLVVELRALPAQRWLQRIVRVGLPLHVVTFCIATALVVGHVFLVLRRPG